MSLDQQFSNEFPESSAQALPVNWLGQPIKFVPHPNQIKQILGNESRKMFSQVL